MRCVPEQKNARAVGMIIAALLLGGGILYAVPHAAQAAGIRVISWLFDLLTIGCVVAAVFLLVRYRMTGFQYVVRTKAEAEDSGLLTACAAGAELNVEKLPPEMLDFVVFRSQGARPGVMECMLGVEQLTAVVPLKRKKTPGRVTSPTTIRLPSLRTTRWGWFSSPGTGMWASSSSRTSGCGLTSPPSGRAG